MRELYIYYTVRADTGAGFASHVAAFQHAMTEAVPGLRARALCRDDNASPPSGIDANPARTWMEIYATDPDRLPDGVDVGMQALIETKARSLARFIDGGRHIEAFVAVPRGCD